MKYGIFNVMSGRSAGGPETYEHNLVESLANIDSENEYHIYCFDENAVNSFNVDQDNFTFHSLNSISRAVAMTIKLPLLTRLHGIDLLHAAYMPPYFSLTPYVFTLHCSSTFVHPEFYPPAVRLRLNMLIKRGMHCARHIMCVSEDVKKRAAEYFKIPEQKMSVVYNGIGDNFKPIDENSALTTLKKYGITTPYILYVGRFEKRKNILRVIQSFYQYKSQHNTQTKLVLAGNKTWAGGDVDKLIKKLKIEEDILHIGHVENDNLPAIYSQASLFCFPSLWEGFGIPVIEAMSCGTPVLTSNLSSLPEVAGGSALLVDPYSIDEIANGIETILSDKKMAETMTHKGLLRSKDFSWDNVAKRSLEIYREFS